MLWHKHRETAGLSVSQSGIVSGKKFIDDTTGRALYSIEASLDWDRSYYEDLDLYVWANSLSSDQLGNSGQANFSSTAASGNRIDGGTWKIKLDEDSVPSSGSEASLTQPEIIANEGTSYYFDDDRIFSTWWNAYDGSTGSAGDRITGTFSVTNRSGNCIYVNGNPINSGESYSVTGLAYADGTGYQGDWGQISVQPLLSTLISVEGAGKFPRTVKDEWELMGYWDPANTGSYPGTGVVYKNLVTGRNDLTLINGPTWITGYEDVYEDEKGFSRAINPVVTGFELDGTNDYIGGAAGGYGDSFIVDLASKWTVCTWVRTNTGTIISGNGPATIFSIGNTQTVGGDVPICPGFELFDTWPNDLRQSGVSRFGFNYATNDPDYLYISGNSTTGLGFVNHTGTWHFVAVEANLGGPGLSDLLGHGSRVYVDGVWQRPTNNAGISSAGTCSFNADKILFGAKYGDPDGGGTDYSPQYTYSNLDGYRYGEIMIYSGNIGSARILQNYQMTKGRYHTGDGSLYSYK